MKRKTKIKICGVGVNDFDGVVGHLKSYEQWRSMLARCYDEKTLERQPTYKGWTVCKEWLYFSNYKEWFDKNYRWDLREKGVKLSLTKDLFENNSKIHSPETCVIIPTKANLFLSTNRKNNTSGTVGVCYQKEANSWFVQIKKFGTGVNKRLGYFKQIEEAKQTYEKARKKEVEKCKEWLKELGYSENIIDKIK